VDTCPPPLTSFFQAEADSASTSIPPGSTVLDLGVSAVLQSLRGSGQRVGGKCRRLLASRGSACFYMHAVRAGRLVTLCRGGFGVEMHEGGMEDSDETGGNWWHA
jgi:hypothetical protein